MGIHLSSVESHGLRSGELSVVTSHQVGLPKVDMKSPGRIIEENDTPVMIGARGEEGEHRRPQSNSCSLSEKDGTDIRYSRIVMQHQDESQSPKPYEVQERRLVNNVSDLGARDDSQSPQPSQEIGQQLSDISAISQAVMAQRRKSSGTPVSVKSKVTPLAYKVLKMQ